MDLLRKPLSELPRGFGIFRDADGAGHGKVPRTAGKGGHQGSENLHPPGAGNGASGTSGPPGESDRAFMERMFASVNGNINSLREDVTQEFRGVYEAMQNTTGRIDGHDTQLEDHKTRIEKMEACIITMEFEQKELQKGLQEAKETRRHGAPAGAPVGRRLPDWASVPKDERKIFVMTNLGWNRPQKELQDRAREILTKASCGQDDIKSLIAPCKYGSLVEIGFEDAATGRAIATKVKDLQETGYDQRVVWMGPITTAEERAPHRKWNKLKEAVVDEYKKNGGEQSV